MADFVSKSIDEILTLIADTFDGLIAPKRIFRNNDNKFWLAFRAISAGFSLVNDIVLVLHLRFDPLNSADSDLYSIGKLTGSDPKLGSGSLITITVTNNDLVNTKVLASGVYQYTSVGGTVFSFDLTAGASVDALGTLVLRAISETVGAFTVSAIASASIVREDGASIDPAFSFSIADNADALGYPDESSIAYRQRINTDTNRQDEISEMELAIRNLPSIFECNIVLNSEASPVAYDGLTIDPYQILIVLLGAPVTQVAKEVATRTIYHTKFVDGTVNYPSANYLSDSYPVNYMYFLYADFELGVNYRFDGSKILKGNAENMMKKALSVYANPVQWTQTLTVNDIFSLLQALGLPSVRIIVIGMVVDGSPVSSIDALKTRLLRMASVSFTGTDVSA